MICRKEKIRSKIESEFGDISKMNATQLEEVALYCDLEANHFNSSKGRMASILIAFLAVIYAGSNDIEGNIILMILAIVVMSTLLFAFFEWDYSIYKNLIKEIRIRKFKLIEQEQKTE